jgi:rRNA maturation RNase YbeY
MGLRIHNRQRTVKLHTPTIRKYVLWLLNYLGCADKELSVVFGNDRLLQELNRTYRHKDKATNVLAFPQYPTYANEPTQHTLLGDVVVSLPTAAREAQALQQPLEHRVVYLVVHGVLHLLGYDHEQSLAQRRRMARRERDILTALQAAFPLLTPFKEVGR